MAYSSDSFSAGETPTTAKWNKMWSNDASFNDGTGIAVSAITPEKLLIGTGTSWPWRSWTPSWTNVTVGNGTVVAAYSQTGKTVNFHLRFTLGSTSSISGSITFSPPVAPLAELYLAATEGYVFGNVKFLDAATAAYLGYLQFGTGSTNISILALNTAASYGQQSTTSSTIPFTFGTSDIIVCTGSYEAA